MLEGMGTRRRFPEGKGFNNLLAYLAPMMRKLTNEESMENAEKYGLKPARVRGREVVQLTKNPGEKFEEIPWEEFFEILKKKRLAVYMSKGGYMKIMSDDVYE